MHLGAFAKKSIEMSKQYIFKQQLISEAQKLLHFSRAWFQDAYKLVANKKFKHHM